VITYVLGAIAPEVADVGTEQYLWGPRRLLAGCAAADLD
jgi:hypothetical protein